MKSLINSFKYAVAGIVYCLKNEHNMRIHFILAISVLLLSVFLGLSALELSIIFLTIVFVLVTEMINTGIEKTVDLFTTDYHPLAKIAKNAAAGSVLVAAVNSIVIAYLILGKKFVLLFNGRLSKSIRLAIFIIIILTIFFLIFTINMWNKKEVK